MINCQTNDLQPCCTLVNSNLQLTTNKKQGTQVQTFERVSLQSRLYHQCRSISASKRMKHRGQTTLTMMQSEVRWEKYSGVCIRTNLNWKFVRYSRFKSNCRAGKA